MPLIDTDGLVLIGPGSEWFWSAISGLALVVTFIAIYRELRLQASANAFAQLDAFDRDLHSERLVWAYYDIVRTIADGVDPAFVPYGSATAMADLWERMGQLVHAGHVRRDVVYAQFSFNVQYDWARLRPFVHRTRAATPVLYEHFEWLAEAMAEVDRRHGTLTRFDDAYLAARLPASIEWCRDQIRTAERMRTMIIGQPLDDADLVIRKATAPGPHDPTETLQP